MSRSQPPTSSAKKTKASPSSCTVSSPPHSKQPHLNIHPDFNHERLWLACTSLRLARVCLQDAYAHATRRETFGKKLIENQIIRAKFSAVGRQLDAATALMENLVYLSQTYGRDAHLGGQFANLKILAGQTLERASREAQQVMGGLGYSKNGRGARVEQISRDVRVMVVGGGSEEILTDLSVSQETKAMAKLAARL